MPKTVLITGAGSGFGRYEVRDVTLGAGSTLRDRNLAMAAG
jgi:NAD(P)-dependent dehydrogenase (short-subunit alcohol dehydrogenase family)